MTAVKPVPTWAQASLAALLAVILVTHEDLPGWALACAVLAPVGAAALLAVRPLVPLGACAAGAAVLGPVMADSVPPWSAALAAALCLISFLAGRLAPRPAPALAVLAGGAVLALLPLLAEGEATGLVVQLVVVVLPWLVGRSARQQADLAAAAAERAHLEERTRIAHEMHDTLGHELSLLALRAGALELAPDLDERQRAAVAQLRVGAGAATERLADVVAVLRGGEPAPPHPVSERVEDLVDRAARAGVAVSLEWDGPRELPAAVERTAHRVVRESLTNAVKHAPGSAVRVRVVAAGATTVVTVVNPLPPGRRRRGGGRVGLVALRERVRLAGGALHVNRGERTFEVVATLPHVAA